MSQNQDKSKQQPTQQNPSSGQQEQAQIKNNPQVQPQPQLSYAEKTVDKNLVN
ncbi:hypothetical protein [Acinetobacter baumannii]|uniref:hypothetical protein n=1 Tax=Acinetobacter baumannii TaxID=470 RepID=UPI00232F1269|nr:hypothetical protein [Acinetobacter baumannii]